MRGVLDLSFLQNGRELPASVQLFSLLLDLTPENNVIPLNKEAFAKYLEIYPQTVAGYFKRFCDSNFMKYRYGGPVFINPDVFYAGKEERLADVRAEYQKFKSSM